MYVSREPCAIARFQRRENILRAGFDCLPGIGGRGAFWRASASEYKSTDDSAPCPLDSQMCMDVHSRHDSQNLSLTLPVSPMIQRRVVCVVLATLAFGGLACASVATSSSATTADITAADLQHRLFLIAHDSMMGRETGSEGDYKATEYIASEFKRLGLE